MLEEIEEVVRKVNPNAEITESSYAAVSLEFLL
jgi:G3E family GTPase